MKKTKIVVIGIDGATFDIIFPLINKGKLPNLKKIINKGIQTTLKSTIPPISPCAWSSFMTGKNPGKHGIYDFFYLDKELNTSINFSNKRSDLEIWQILSNYGYKCIVFNVPLTYPPKKINGIMITGFTTPSLNSNFTYPKDFRNELLKTIPDFRLNERTKYSERKNDKIAYLNDIFELTNIHLKTIKWLMTEFNWDFFMTVFMGTDHIQHWYWKYMDEKHPNYDRNSPEIFKKAIENIYKKIDTSIGELLKVIPDNTDIIIMSDHGAGLYYKDIFINNWLIKRGYLKIRKNLKTFLKRILSILKIDPRNLINFILKIGLGNISSKISLKSKKRLLEKFSLNLKDIDWSKTKAFSFGYYAPIYINSKKRWKFGIVSEDKCGILRDKIIKELKEIKDPITNKSIVSKVWKKEELYFGNNIDKLPDISFSADNFAYGSSSTFPFASKKIFNKPITKKSGDHREDGILIMYGKDFKKGKKLKSVNIIDITPTILHIFNIPTPKDCDGRVIKEIFEKETKLFKRPIKYANNINVKI